MDELTSKKAKAWKIAAIAASRAADQCGDHELQAHLREAVVPYLYKASERFERAYKKSWAGRLALDKEAGVVDQDS